MSKLNPTERARLRSLFDENGLTPDDIFQHNHFTVITRAGIEKIQAKRGIEIEYQVESLQPEFIVIKAVGVMEEDRGPKKGTRTHRVETYGEASKQNNRTSYPVAMAEKRALSRCVLKLCGLYSETNVIGEDERPE
jgi:hypothetical protein